MEHGPLSSMIYLENGDVPWLRRFDAPSGRESLATNCVQTMAETEFAKMTALVY